MVDSLREIIESQYVVEREGWAAERVARVTERLQAGVPLPDRFETLVLWTDAHNAFTGPGKTIYFGRRLLQQMPDDEAAAFVIAHELAHHQLGHVPTLTRAILALPVSLVILGLSRWIATSQRETDADLRAVELCLDAGYDIERCLHAIEQLCQIYLDYGDIDGVFGREDGKDMGTHPPHHHRLAAARAHAHRVRTQGHRLALDLDARRARRRRRYAIAAGAAAVGIALVILRRQPRPL
jgi:predicted Zn-dependent protease